MLPHVTYCVAADATNETALRDIGIESFDLAVVATGEQVHSSILCTVLLKRLGLPHVVARAENELHGLTLEKIGADQVVYPERESGERLAYNLAYSGVRDYLRLQEGYGVSRIYPPREFQGRTIDEVDLGPRSCLRPHRLGPRAGQGHHPDPRQVRAYPGRRRAGHRRAGRWAARPGRHRRARDVGRLLRWPTRHIIDPPGRSRPAERTP